jgi:hypothetical protein
VKRWLANKLVALARWIDPPNEAFLEFTMDRMMDMMIKGRSIVKVTFVEDEEFHQ